MWSVDQSLPTTGLRVCGTGRVECCIGKKNAFAPLRPTSIHLLLPTPICNICPTDLQFLTVVDCLFSEGRQLLQQSTLIVRRRPILCRAVQLLPQRQHFLWKMVRKGINTQKRGNQCHRFHHLFKSWKTGFFSRD